MDVLIELYNKAIKRYKNVKYVRKPLYDSLVITTKDAYVRIVYDKITNYVIVNSSRAKRVIRYLFEKKIEFDNFVLYNDKVYKVISNDNNTFVRLNIDDVRKYNIKLIGWHTQNIYVDYDVVNVILEKDDDIIILKFYDNKLVNIECNIKSENYQTLIKLIKRFKRNYFMDRILLIIEKFENINISITNNTIDIFGETKNGKIYYIIDFNSILNNFDEVYSIIKKLPSYIEFIYGEPYVVKFTSHYFTEIIYYKNCKRIVTNDPKVIKEYLDTEFNVNGLIKFYVLFGELIKYEYCTKYNGDVYCNEEEMIKIAECISKKISSKDVRLIVDNKILIDVFTRDPSLPSITLVIEKESNDFVLKFESDADVTYIQSKIDDVNSIIYEVLSIIGSCGVKIEL